MKKNDIRMKMFAFRIIELGQTKNWGNCKKPNRCIIQQTFKGNRNISNFSHFQKERLLYTFNNNVMIIIPLVSTIIIKKTMIKKY